MSHRAAGPPEPLDDPTTSFRRRRRWMRSTLTLNEAAVIAAASERADGTAASCTCVCAGYAVADR